MKTNKTLYLLTGCLAISLLINAVVIHNTLAFRGYLKDKYLASVKDIVDSMELLNDGGGNRYLMEQGIGQGFATGMALDEQFRLDDSKPLLHLRIVQEMSFAAANENKNYSDEEKLKIVDIYYKHIKTKDVTRAYIDIRSELMQQNLDHGIPSAETNY